MPIPSITSVTPSSAPTGGRLLCEILGGGFALLAQADAVGSTTPSSPTVRVFVGGRPAHDVQVLAADRSTFLVPSGNPGVVDIRVQNVNAEGSPVPGEQALDAILVAYQRPPQLGAA